MQRSSAMLQMLTPIATRLRSAMATAGDETLHLYDTIDLMDGAVSPLAASTQLPTATQDIICTPRTVLINSSITTSSFPDMLKRAEVTPIYKE